MDTYTSRVVPENWFRVERRGFSSFTQFKVWLVGTEEPEAWSTWWELTPEQQAVFSNGVKDRD